jgi:Tfp pilus assembly protein PilV
MRRTRIKTARRGLSLFETMIALTILGTSLISMAEYGRRFAKSSGAAMTTNTALDIATERIERVKAERNYVSMDTLAGTVSVVKNVNGVNLTYSQLTTITRISSSQVDYKIVTVRVTRATMATPIKKTTAVARF